MNGPQGRLDMLSNMAVSEEYQIQSAMGLKRIRSKLITKCMQSIVQGVPLLSLMPELAQQGLVGLTGGQKTKWRSRPATLSGEGLTIKMTL